MQAQRIGRRQSRQLFGETPAVLGEVLQDDVNLVAWRRQLPLHVGGFAETLLARGEPLAESLTLEPDADGEVQLAGLAANCRDIAGHAGFVADVAWLVRAFACLLEARCVGLRLRLLDRAMCPRFHVDHVPLRLITTYAGAGSQWLRETAMRRELLGNPAAEPLDAESIEQLHAGEVALFKGEKWLGNEGSGIIHRSPPAGPAERRLILTLDWLG